MTATIHPVTVTSRPVTIRAAAGPAGRTRRPAAARDTPRPNYAARRVGAAVLTLLVLATAAVAVDRMVDAVADLGGRPAAASEVVADTGTPAVHVAAAGDTLWSIADRYRGDVGRDRYVDALVALNGGTSILVGQAVRLP
jgi:Tfp pilus assembly protein FimV